LVDQIVTWLALHTALILLNLLAHIRNYIDSIIGQFRNDYTNKEALYIGRIGTGLTSLAVQLVGIKFVWFLKVSLLTVLHYVLRRLST
jgi:hypothetical protein